MSAECYPMSVLPHITRLYADYLAMAESSGPVRQWYAAEPLGNGWMNREVAVDVYKRQVYDNAPGGHYFNRMDTPLALQSRHEIYIFLAGYLHPENPPK